MSYSLSRALSFLRLVLICAFGFGFGCQSIAGIEDRTLDTESATQASELCQSYCESVMAHCVGENQAYSEIRTCLGICEQLEPGDTLEPVGNSVTCRGSQAELAQTTGEHAVHCPRAGPGGNGVCGDDCDSYCKVYAAVCPGEFNNQFSSQEDCLAKCAGLKDLSTFDAIENYNGDTLQCRLVHLSSATVSTEHCSHARLLPTNTCVLGQDEEPVCADWCHTAMTACTGSESVYESQEQCETVCAALPSGTPKDELENNTACRRYHAYNALLDVSHCSHTGPGGDGHCGKPDSPGFTANCESYCLLLETACSPEFAAAFATQAECQSACAELPGAAMDSDYSVTSATGNTLQCRLLHTSRALSDPTQCTAALGGTPCQ